jgi:hypothetical protein
VRLGGGIRLVRPARVLAPGFLARQQFTSGRQKYPE